MYGDPPILGIRKRLRQMACYHAPAHDNAWDYRCQKCGFGSDRPLSGFKLRHLGWLLTGRMPKEN